MKCHYRVNPDIMLELEGASQKDLFKAMADAAEIFGGWSVCGCCQDAKFKPRPVVRYNKKKQPFYELRCTNPGCRARFEYGQHQDTPTLFPQRRFPATHAKAGEYKPNGGWTIWKKEDEDDSSE